MKALAVRWKDQKGGKQPLHELREQSNVQVADTCIAQLFP